MTAGRHRDPDDVVTDLIATITGPLRRPSRQQLIDVAGQFRWPPPRPAAPPAGELPATGWDQAAVPAPADEDEDQTVRFSLADLGASTGATLLPVALSGPDPAPRTLAPWQTGEMAIVRDEPAPAQPVSLLDLVLGAGAFLFVIAAVLLTLALAPGGA